MRGGRGVENIRSILDIYLIAIEIRAVIFSLNLTVRIISAHPDVTCVTSVASITDTRAVGTMLIDSAHIRTPRGVIGGIEAPGHVV